VLVIQFNKTCIGIGKKKLVFIKIRLRDRQNKLLYCDVALAKLRYAVVEAFRL